MARSTFDVRKLGDRAIRFARPSGPSAGALVDAVRSWPGVVDVVVTAQHVAACFDREPAITDDDPALAALATATGASAATPRTIELPARYDGIDLAEVARAVDRSVAAVCELHASATYVVEMMGFAPGFAYMSGLPSVLELPRRTTPRPSVPAGSIAVAGHYTAVYPFDSPGGWHLLGRVVDLPMFDAAGARLQLGDRVRFVPS